MGFGQLDFWRSMSDNCRAAGYDCLINFGRGTVSKILNKYQIKTHKIKYYLEKKDPEFDEKWLKSEWHLGARI